MRVTASAPGRCGIIGNPSDIYGGVLVSCSIPARATCTLTTGAERLPEDPLLWNAATSRYPVSGVSVDWQSDIPRSSGLAGSTALLAATLACVRKLVDHRVGLDGIETRTEFAEEVRDVEFHEAGVVCGYQDAYMVVHGGLKRMDFGSKHPAVQGGLPGETRELDAPELPLLLVTTGVERLSGSVHAPVRDRWLAGELAVIEEMNRLTELGNLGAEAIESGDWQAVAEAMNENHRIVQQLDLSGDPIDRLIEACLDSGALAAKLAGAGMGGTVIALAEDVDALEEALRSRGYERFMRPAVSEGLRLEAFEK